MWKGERHLGHLRREKERRGRPGVTEHEPKSRRVRCAPANRQEPQAIGAWNAVKYLVVGRKQDGWRAERSRDVFVLVLIQTTRCLVGSRRFACGTTRHTGVLEFPCDLAVPDAH